MSEWICWWTADEYHELIDDERREKKLSFKEKKETRCGCVLYMHESIREMDWWNRKKNKKILSMILITRKYVRKGKPKIIECALNGVIKVLQKATAERKKMEKISESIETMIKIKLK